MDDRFRLKVASVNMVLAVGLGAFGAHLLKDILTPETRATYQTGTIYHLVHGLAAWVLARAGARLPWTFMMLGCLFFSGSLYVLAVSGIKAFGAVAPIGGLCFILGWGTLAWKELPAQS